MTNNKKILKSNKQLSRQKERKVWRKSPYDEYVEKKFHVKTKIYDVSYILIYIYIVFYITIVHIVDFSVKKKWHSNWLSEGQTSS